MRKYKKYEKPSKSLAKARLFCYNMIEYRCESPDEEVNAMRLTRREMEEQYPNQWLGITNEEFAEVNGGMGIIAADVVYVNADPLVRRPLIKLDEAIACC